MDPQPSGQAALFRTIAMGRLERKQHDIAWHSMTSKWILFGWVSEHILKGLWHFGPHSLNNRAHRIGDDHLSEHSPTTSPNQPVAFQLHLAVLLCFIVSLGMGLLWARDFEHLWEVHGSRCSFFVPSCPHMLVANDIAARSHLYDIYIYMHTSKISSSWVTRNKTYCTCTARNYITLSTVLCHLASEYQREKFNFALLRHAQMIGFCLLLCCRFL